MLTERRGRVFEAMSPRRGLARRREAPAWHELIAPPDAAPRRPGQPVDVTVIGPLSAHSPASDASDGASSTRRASGLISVYRAEDHEGTAGPRGSAVGGSSPRSAPCPEPTTIPATVRHLERSVVELGLRTEALAASLDRLDGSLLRLLTDVMETRNRLRATATPAVVSEAEHRLRRLHGQLQQVDNHLRTSVLAGPSPQICAEMLTG